MTPSEAKALARTLIPSLTTAWRKGQQGRVGIVGGSVEYTGAPFYAGISALKTGADLCHIFCTQEAAIPIKSYSPELIVHPLLRSDASVLGHSSEEADAAVNESIQRISQVLPRLDTLVLGPGLGRDTTVLQITAALIARAREMDLPVVLDGDALFLVSEKPDIICGYKRAVLTPNAMEYARLCFATKLVSEVDPVKAAIVSPAKLSSALGFPVVVQKGETDRFSDGTITVENNEFGCPRRCGGQGDVLAGSIATFVSWSKHAQVNFTGNPLLLAAFGGSTVTRASSLEAFSIHRRSMTAPDVLHSIGNGFERAFPEAPTPGL